MRHEIQKDGTLTQADAEGKTRRRDGAGGAHVRRCTQCISVASQDTTKGPARKMQVNGDEFHRLCIKFGRRMIIAAIRDGLNGVTDSIVFYVIFTRYSRIL